MKRLDPYCISDQDERIDGFMREAEDGDYVRWEDYERLQKELNGFKPMTHEELQAHAVAATSLTSNLESIPEVTLDAEQKELAYQLKARWERPNGKTLIPLTLTRYIVYLHDELAKLRTAPETPCKQACAHCRCWHRDGDGCCYCSTTERRAVKTNGDVP